MKTLILLLLAIAPAWSQLPSSAPAQNMGSLKCDPVTGNCSMGTRVPDGSESGTLISPTAGILGPGIYGTQNSVVGAPTTVCQFGAMAAQVDASAGQRLWFCAGAGTYWQNLSTGQLSAVARSYTYYVDSSAGNDTNLGTSDSTPLLTLAAALAKPLVYGASIGLKAGSTWKELAAVVVPGITIGPYGVGAMPIIDASAVVATSWSKTAGRTNIYEASITVAAGGSTQIWAWENNVELPRAASMALCDSTAGSSTVSADVNGTVTLYVHSPDGSDPGSNGKTYEFSARQNALNVTADYFTALGIETRRGNNSDGAFRVAAHHATLVDCISRDGAVHNYYVMGNVVVRNCQAFNGSYGQFVLHDGDSSGGSAVFTDCATSSLKAGAQGFYAHTGGPPAYFATVSLVRFNSYAPNGSGPGANEVTVFNLRDCTTTAGSGLSSASGTTTITGGSVTSATRGVTANGTHVIIAGVMFAGGGGVFANAAGVRVDLSNSYGVGPIQITGSGSSLNCLGNTFGGYAAIDGSTVIYSLSGVAAERLVSDQNTYLSNNYAFEIGGVSYATIPTLRSVLGKELAGFPASRPQLIPTSDSTNLTTTQWSQSGAFGANRSATTITENFQAGTVHGAVYKFSPYPLVPNGLYTVLFEVKPNGRNWVFVAGIDSASGSGVYFDLSNGVVGTTTGTIYASGITPATDGYFRVWVSSRPTSNAAASAVSVLLATGDGVVTYAGDGASGVLVRLTKVSDGGAPL